MSNALGRRQVAAWVTGAAVLAALAVFSLSQAVAQEPTATASPTVTPTASPTATASPTPGPGTGAGLWSGEIPASGVALLTFEGTTLAELVASAEAQGFVSVFTTAEGEFVGYIVGAPDFVNAEFTALFQAGISPGTPMVVSVG